MPWIRIDDHYDEHPKLARVGPLGQALWLAGLAYCNRNMTDGFIPWGVAGGLISLEFIDADERAHRIYGGPEIPDDEGFIPSPFTASFVIKLLTDAGVWDFAPFGYQVHDYCEYQPTKAQILEERAKKAAAGSAGGRATAAARATAPDAAESQQKRTPKPKTNPTGESHLSVKETNDLDSRSDKALQPGPLVPEHFTETAALLEELTGVVYALRDPWGAMWRQIEEQIRRHSAETVHHRMRLIASRLDNPGVDEIVFGTGNSLRRKVETEDVKAVERVESEEASIARRLERTQIRVHEGGGHADPSQFPRCPMCRDATPALEAGAVVH